MVQKLGFGQSHPIFSEEIGGRGSLLDVDVTVPSSSMLFCFFQASPMWVHVEDIEGLLAVDIPARSMLLSILLVFAHQHNDARIVVVA